MSEIGSILYKAVKSLAAILNPLRCKNVFTIKNSEDFVNKIRDLEVPPHRMLVSYDVSALVTSIPVDEALHVIEGGLENDTSLSERCELSIDQIITILEFSLNTTYFVLGLHYVIMPGCMYRLDGEIIIF